MSGMWPATDPGLAGHCPAALPKGAVATRQQAVDTDVPLVWDVEAHDLHELTGVALTGATLAVGPDRPQRTRPSWPQVPLQPLGILRRRGFAPAGLDLNPPARRRPQARACEPVLLHHIPRGASAPSGLRRGRCSWRPRPRGLTTRAVGQRGLTVPRRAGDELGSLSAIAGLRGRDARCVLRRRVHRWHIPIAYRVGGQLRDRATRASIT